LRFSRGPSRDFGARVARSPARSPAPGSTLLRSPSPSGSCSVRRVALYRLPALPPRRSRRPRGFPRRTLPRNMSLASFPRGVRSSPESCELRLRPPAPSPARPLRKGDVSFQGLAGLPLLRFLLPRTQLRRVPLSTTCFLAVARVGRGSPDPRRCRPQGSCPSRRFRQARGSLEIFWTSPFAVAPDASQPCSMPLASLERPSRAFPSRGAVPALAGRLLPCGFALRPPPA